MKRNQCNGKKTKEGSRKVQKKVVNAWTEEQLQDALHEIDSVPSTTIRGVAKRYGIHEATIRFRLKKRREGTFFLINLFNINNNVHTYSQ